MEHPMRWQPFGRAIARALVLCAVVGWAVTASAQRAAPGSKPKAAMPSAEKAVSGAKLRAAMPTNAKITRLKNATHPNAERFNQGKALALAGDEIVIEGSGFGADRAGRSLRYEAPLRKATEMEVIAWSDRRIRVRVPGLAALGWSQRELDTARAGSRTNGSITIVGLEAAGSIPLSIVYGLKKLDLDGDGHVRLESGGGDCDDFSPERYPDAVEICDAGDVDEDCNYRTFGPRDQDGDRAIDAACRNVTPTGEVYAGTDCNDQRPDVHPLAAEVCDGIDNNCNKGIDDGLLNCPR